MEHTTSATGTAVAACRLADLPPGEAYRVDGAVGAA
jgi:hypothetical protein